MQTVLFFFFFHSNEKGKTESIEICSHFCIILICIFVKFYSHNFDFIRIKQERRSLLFFFFSQYIVILDLSMHVIQEQYCYTNFQRSFHTILSRSCMGFLFQLFSIHLVPFSLFRQRRMSVFMIF